MLRLSTDTSVSRTLEQVFMRIATSADIELEPSKSSVAAENGGSGLPSADDQQVAETKTGFLKHLRNGNGQSKGKGKDGDKAYLLMDPTAAPPDEVCAHVHIFKHRSAPQALLQPGRIPRGPNYVSR